MKRCPTCNQTFEEEWLSFCTQDGTTLMESEATGAPTPTVIAAPSATPSSSNEQATWNLPSGSGPSGLPAEPQRAQAAWQPPPPPLYAVPANKSLSVAAMVLGIISVTVGWICFGPIPGIAAVILGAVALSQIKKDPERFTGKQFAWTGVITGSITVLIYLVVMLFYIILIAIGAANR